MSLILTHVDFVCEECDYKASSSSVLKRHITMKHKRNSNHTSGTSAGIIPDIPSSASSSISLSSTAKPPIACSRSCYGCPNRVSQYEHEDAAICPTCKLTLASKLNSSPYPSNLCPSCHETNCDLPFSFCEECMNILKTKRFLDSRLGFLVFRH